MQQRIELSRSQNRPTVTDGCSDLTLAITDEDTSAHLMLPPSVARIQITGKESLNGLTLSGNGQTVRITASSRRSIHELQIDCVILELDNLTVLRLHLLDGACDLPSGIFFVDVLEPPSISYVSAPQHITVLRRNPGGFIGVLVGRDTCARLGSDMGDAQVDFDPSGEIAHLNVEQLRVPSLAVDIGVCLTLKDWAYGAREYLVVLALAREAVLRLAEKASIGPVKVDAPEGSLELSSAIAERVAGVLGCLTTSGPCVFRGDNLQLSRLRCSVGADVSGLVIYSLDFASLSHAAQASAFDIILPKDQSWRTFCALTASSTWWREPAAWRALYQQLEQKGRPATAAWARHMERETRRKLTSYLSVEYAVLESAHLLGYGERVLRPLFAQAIVALFGWALIVIARAHPTNYKTRDLLWLLPRLYLAPLSVLRSVSFAPYVETSIVAYLIWAGVALSGVICFATAALAVRRFLAYS